MQILRAIFVFVMYLAFAPEAFANITTYSCGIPHQRNSEHRELEISKDGVFVFFGERRIEFHPFDVRWESYDGKQKGFLKNGDRLLSLDGVDITGLTPEDLKKAICTWMRTFFGGTVTVERTSAEPAEKTVILTIEIPTTAVANLWGIRFHYYAKDLKEELAEVALRLVATSSPKFEGVGIKFSAAISNPSGDQALPGHIMDVIEPGRGVPSPAYDAGIRSGDRIVKINGITLQDTMDKWLAAGIIAEQIRTNESSRFVVKRDGKTFEAVVKKALIFDGSAPRFFKYREEIARLDGVAYSLDNLVSDVLYPLEKGETADVYGNDITEVIENFPEFIDAWLTKYQDAMVSVRKLGDAISYDGELECPFINRSGCPVRVPDKELADILAARDDNLRKELEQDESSP